MNPKVLIPMHFKTEKCGFPLAPVGDFLQWKGQGEYSSEASEAHFEKASLPAQYWIFVAAH